MIEIKNLTFSYTDKNIFEEVNSHFDENWHLALVGRNGRGKTTLLNLLRGKYEYSGRISSPRQFVYFPQNVLDKSQLTYYVLQELMDFEDWELKRELNQLGFPEDGLWRAFDSLSGGEQTKALLSLLFLDDSSLPLIDEPTNHLDKESRSKVADYLKKKRQGYIVVSHDRAFLDEVSDHVLAIEKNQLIAYQGNFSTYEQEKKMRDEFELAQNEKLASEVSRLKRTSRDKEDWSKRREGDIHGNPNIKGSGGTGHDGKITARAARVMKKAKVLERRMNSEIEEKEKLLKNLEFIDSLSMNYTQSRKEKLLTIQDMTVSFDEGKLLFKPVSFEVDRGQVTAITGPNGIGKSQLLDRLYTYAESKKLKISCVRQIYDDNTGYIKDWADEKKLDYQDLLNNLKKLGMERDVFKQKIEDMSMGQQKKVELARSLSTPAELYIWDEPLNYLDVFNHKQIEDLISNIKPTMLIVEHDKYFIDKLADQKIELQKTDN